MAFGVIIEDGSIDDLKMFNNGIKAKKCPICGEKLIEKGDWIFCPKYSTEIPDPEYIEEYHIVYNKATGKGFLMNKKDYLDLIDKKYYEAKKKRVSRFSDEWGEWSTKMNRGIRAREEFNKDKEGAGLRHIIIYWTLRSQMLELSYKSRILGKNKIRILAREAADIKKLILSDNLKDIFLEQLSKIILR